MSPRNSKHAGESFWRGLEILLQDNDSAQWVLLILLALIAVGVWILALR